jgi:hypothetical protein
MSVGCVGAVAVDRIFIDHPSSLNTYLQDNAVKMERFLLWPDVGINNWEVLAGAARQLFPPKFLLADTNKACLIRHLCQETVIKSENVCCYKDFLGHF